MAKRNDWKDRKRRTESVVTQLLQNMRGAAVLDIGGVDFEVTAAKHDWHYVTIDLAEPQNVGTGGHQRHTTMTYDGRTLPFEEKTFDLVNVGFVLHHASENTLPLLQQISKIARRYITIGEDVAEQNYPMEWHRRNWEHHPGGIFRSDNEWRIIFELLGWTLLNVYYIPRQDDFDQERPYRVLYVLDVRKPVGSVMQ